VSTWAPPARNIVEDDYDDYFDSGAFKTGLAAARVFRLKNNIKTSSLYFDIDDLPVNLMEFSELLQRNQQVNCPRSTGNTANQLHNHSLRWVEFLKVILLL
jgi:hypothetical protein